jgi:hypothetical protein
MTQVAGIAAVMLLFLSFHLWGVKVFIIGPGPKVDVAPWDIAALIVGLIWMARLLSYRASVPRALYVGIGLMLLFEIWVIFQGTRGPVAFRSATMVLLGLRDLVLLVSAGTLASHIRDIRKLNSAIFLLGVFIAAASVLLYALNFDVVRTIRRPFGGIILLIDAEMFPRLLGFARDPNFFAMFMSVSLMCGAAEDRMRQPVRWAGLAITAAAIVLTLSRTAVAAVPLSILLMSLFVARSSGSWRRFTLRSNIRQWITVVAVVAGVFVILSIVTGPLFEWTVYRFVHVLDSPRLKMWSILVSEPSVFLLGAGLRSAEEALGGTYSHNSYLDLLYETGIVGFALWLSFALFVLKKGLALVNTAPETTPWVQSLFVVMMMMGTLSILYHPIFWIVAAVILSQCRLLSSHGFSRRVEN